MPETVEASLRRVLARYPSIRLAILFGSLASDAARPDSDMDLAVAAARPLGSEEKMALIADLAAASGRPVDLVDLNTAGEPLLGEIVTRGRRILGQDTDYARLLFRHVMEAADFLPYRSDILAQRRQAWIGR